MSLKSRWPMVKRRVLERDSWTCQACGGYGGDVHHRLARGMGGSSNPDTYLGMAGLVTLCRVDHQLIHQNPLSATERGFIVRNGTDPETVPVQTIFGTVMFDIQGGTHECDA